jgi:teichuronic acid biosynthesis protein TuaE
MGSHAQADESPRAVSEILSPYFVIVVAAAMIHVAVSYGPIYLVHIALVVLLSRAAMAVLLERELVVPAPRGFCEWAGVVFVIAYCVSWIWSIDHVRSINYVGYVGIGLLILISAAGAGSSPKGMRRLLRLVGTITVLQILISLLEIFTSFRLPVSPFSEYAGYFGRTDKLASLSGSEALLQQALRSPTGFHWNPNNLAIAMVMALPFFLNAKGVVRRWVGVAGVLIVIVFTASRASVIGAMLVFVVHFTMLSTRRIAVVIGIVLPITMLCGMLFSGHLTRFSEQIEPVAAAIDAASRIFGPRSTQSDSVGIRQQLTRNAIQSIQDRVGLGVGPGGSVLVQRAAGGPAAEIGSMHNFWLEIAVDAGVLALCAFVACYLSAWLVCVVIAFYARRPLYRYVGRSLAGALAGFSVALISASSVLYFPPMWVMFGMVLGLGRAVASSHGVDVSDRVGDRLAVSQTSPGVSA